MSFEEITAYSCVAGAFLAFVWAFMSHDGDIPADAADSPGMDRLPGIFKATWNFAILFEDSAGATIAGILKKKAEKIDRLSVVSALPLDAKRVFGASFALGLACLFLGVSAATVAIAAADGKFPVWAVAGCAFFPLAGWQWPVQNLAHYAEVRQEKLVRELPFAIDLIGGAMRSGLDFGAALRYYVSSGEGSPLTEEFGRVLADVSLGRSMSESLVDMAERVCLPAFSSFAGVVSYGLEVGAPIADTLKVHGAELRRERFAVAERKAQRAPAVMIIPLVLFIMPSVFIVVMTPMVYRLKDFL